MLWSIQREAADILIKMHLNSRKNVTLSSNLKILVKRIRKRQGKMGQFDAARWNAFYKWDKENGILKEDLTDKRLHQRICEIMTEIRLEHVSYAYGQE